MDQLSINTLNICASSVKLIATYGVDVIIIVTPAVFDAAVVIADTHIYRPTPPPPPPPPSQS
jgi:hypothetical protein